MLCPMPLGIFSISLNVETNRRIETFLLVVFDITELITYYFCPIYINFRHITM